MPNKRLTAITTEIDGIPYIRGYALPELLQRVSFGDAIFLILTGELPTPKQRTIFNAILVTAIDHGLFAPSTDVARRVASNGNPVNTAVAAGVAAIGDAHGGAIEQAGRLFQDALALQDLTLDAQATWVVTQGLTQYKRLPGYGHKIYTVDPRVTALFMVAAEQELLHPALTLARLVEQKLEAVKKKKLCLNVDGGMAAVCTAVGLPWQKFRGLFIIARTPGLVAHTLEQMQREPPVLRSEDAAVTYDGPSPRPVPHST